DDMEARVLLAETYRREGDLNAALRVLEDARMEQKRNPELLLQAADINEQQLNYTAAYDNTALVLKLSPKNHGVLERLVGYCRRLERYDEAIAHQEQVLKLTSGADYEREQDRLAHLELERTLMSG